MKFERTTDYALIRSILTHPKLFDKMGDDFSAPLEEFQPNEDPRIWYVLAIDTEHYRVAGLFGFIPENDICWAVHVAMLPWAWGLTAWYAGRRIVPWIWAHTPCLRIVASVPSYNRLAVQYGLRVMRLQQFGINPASIQMRGKLWPQVLMGISKPMVSSSA